MIGISCYQICYITVTTNKILLISLVNRSSNAEAWFAHNIITSTLNITSYRHTNNHIFDCKLHDQTLSYGNKSTGML
jgi:hypothetical protein